jgi:hypothetical protein
MQYGVILTMFLPKIYLSYSFKLQGSDFICLLLLLVIFYLLCYVIRECCNTIIFVVCVVYIYI